MADRKTSVLSAMEAARRDGGGTEAVLSRAAKRICRGNLDALAQLLSVLGNRHRLGILTGLLEGPATYRWLGRHTRLAAGPLYFHIHQLRLAGLVRPKVRDLYSLTRGGRNLLLAALSLGALSRDARARPTPSA